MSSELLVVNSFVRGYPCPLNTGIWYCFTRFKWPRPLNESVRLIKVTFVGFIRDSIRDFGNCPLNFKRNEYLISVRKSVRDSS